MAGVQSRAPQPSERTTKGANGKLTFMPGVNAGFIDVDVVDDNLFEAALETFSVELVANETRLASISPTEGLLRGLDQG